MVEFLVWLIGLMLLEFFGIYEIEVGDFEGCVDDEVVLCYMSIVWVWGLGDFDLWMFGVEDGYDFYCCFDVDFVYIVVLQVFDVIVVVFSYGVVIWVWMVGCVINIQLEFFGWQYFDNMGVVVLVGLLSEGWILMSFGG